MRRGNVYQIANGYMGYRGTLDEFGPSNWWASRSPGSLTASARPGASRSMHPTAASRASSLGGVELSVLGNKVTRHRQTLRFANAVFERETVFASKGTTLTISSARFLSADTPTSGVIRFSVTCTGLPGHGPHRHRRQHLGPERPAPPPAVGERRDSVLLVQGRTSESSKRVVGRRSCRHLALARSPTNPGEPESPRDQPPAEAGRPTPSTSISRCSPTMTPSKAGGGGGGRGRPEGEVAWLRGLPGRHNAEWRNKWDRSDVTIEGDDEAQLALRYSILQLLMVAPVKGSANSIPARALSGQVYKGAIFWDTEMFMFPFFLHTYPEKAVELMRYRIKTLDGARRKAKTEGLGYRGAFYAWESQETGDDACTYFNIGDPSTVGSCAHTSATSRCTSAATWPSRCGITSD
jgi:nigerose phosphorylase